jgi:6-phosphogluconolactonase
MTMTDGMTRRAAVTAAAVTGAGLLLPGIARAARRRQVVAGTYAGGGGDGLYRLGYEPGTGRWALTPALTAIRNASFAVRDGRGRWYALGEGDEGTVTAYGPGWQPLGRVSSGGAGPCHLALDRAGRCLAVANYGGGSVGLLQLDRREGVAGRPAVFRHEGSGPNAARQTAPHAHWVGFSPDQRWLHAVDLGADAIFAYPFDAHARSVQPPRPAWRAPAGAGPRHLARHPKLPIAYVVCELSNQLMTLDVQDDGGFVTRATLSTLPAGFTAASQAAHIAIDRAGQRLYVSNRGHDSIAVFVIEADGVPRPVQHVASGGHWPRMFLLLEDARQMLVGNERSGTIAVLGIERDGTLSSGGSAAAQTLTVPGVAFLGLD